VAGKRLMEFKQLEMFIAVVEEDTVSKAADRVFRSQAAVSIALKKLEEEVGAALFDRAERRDFLLTEAGTFLYGCATRILRLREEALAGLADLATLARGHLRVGANESISSYLLPTIIEEFHAGYPHITLEAVCRHSDALLRDLAARKLDLALLASVPEDPELETEAVMRDELALIVSPGHRLMRAGRIHIRDLGREWVIIEGAESSLRVVVEAAFTHFETPLHIGVESATIETIKRMVAKNLGVGFVPLMCVRDELARGVLAVVAVEGFRHERTLSVARRRGGAHSPAAAAFLRVTLSLAKKLLEGLTGPALDPDDTSASDVVH
jgi:DNA-binding transcriptional LysR family regulator